MKRKGFLLFLAVVNVVALMALVMQVAQAAPVEKFEVSPLISVAPVGFTGACLSYNVAAIKEYSIFGDAGLAGEAGGDTVGFIGASTDAPFVPIIFPAFTKLTNGNARYMVTYIPQTDEWMFATRCKVFGW